MHYATSVLYRAVDNPLLAGSRDNSRCDRSRVVQAVARARKWPEHSSLLGSIFRMQYADIPDSFLVGKAHAVVCPY